MKMKRKIVVSAVAAMLSVIAIIVAMQLMGPRFEHPDVGATLAHAADAEPGAGCAKCHTQPISGTCTSCHPAPPIQLVDKLTNITIAFPHHNTAPGVVAPSACQLCHVSVDNDVRSVTIPELKHNFCGKCHQFKHA